MRIANDDELAVINGQDPAWRKILALLEAGWERRDIEYWLDLPHQNKYVFQVRYALDDAALRKEIARLYEGDWTQREICAELSVKPTTVHVALHIEGVEVRKPGPRPRQ